MAFIQLLLRAWLVLTAAVPLLASDFIGVYAKIDRVVIDNDTAQMISQVIGVIFIALIGFAVWWSVRGGKLKLAAGEVRLAAIYGNCPQHRFGGLVITGSPSDGRIVLTNQRLIFTNLQEAKVGFAVAKGQILSVTKGSKGPLMTLELVLTGQSPP